MKFVIERKQNKVIINKVLFLSKQANKAKKQDSSVIDATIGMMFDENYQFYTPNTVSKVIKQLNNYDTFSYLDTNGGSDYHNAVLSWVFGDFLSEIEEKVNFGVMATAGGSGALGLIFSNYLDYNQKVLLPSNMWTPYIQMAEERNLGYETYNLYDENNNFDVNNFKEKIKLLHQKQDKIVVVINDPCHNPTGLCMSDYDYDQIIDFLNSIDYKVTLLMDIAYIDYYNNDINKARNRFAKIANLNENILTTFAFSGSKTFSLYGLRVGACIAMSKNKDTIKEFESSTEYTARATWSNINTLGVNTITKIVSDSTYKNEFINEVIDIQNILSVRANAFIEESKKYNLDIGAYELGFFICIKCDDPVTVSEKLIKEKVYVCPMIGCIRVSVSCISIEEATRLPKIIRKCLD